MMRLLWVGLLCVLVCLPSMAQEEVITLTTAEANLYTEPRPDSPIIANVPIGTVVRLIQISVDGQWVYVLTATLEQGWLPMSAFAVPIQPTPTFSPQIVLDNELFWGFDADIKTVWTRGQALGLDPTMFAKVGDSITVAQQFLTPIGYDVVEWGEYPHLQQVVDVFSANKTASTNPFSRFSPTAGVGWSTRDLFTAVTSCGASLSRLVCEYQTIRPSIAIIMIGTNDVWSLNLDDYKRNLRTILQTTLNAGILPIISTIPPQPMGSNHENAYNVAIVELAHELDVPLVNYWLAMTALPNLGLSSDLVHPSSPLNGVGTTVFNDDNLQYGYTVRNLMTLQALDLVLRQVV